jgi:hypothetical protein
LLDRHYINFEGSYLRHIALDRLHPIALNDLSSLFLVTLRTAYSHHMLGNSPS